MYLRIQTEEEDCTMQPHDVIIIYKHSYLATPRTTTLPSSCLGWRTSCLSRLVDKHADEMYLPLNVAATTGFVVLC